MEVWKEIPNYDGKYLASNLGRIKSLHRSNERILKDCYSKKGYKRVHLYLKSKGKVIPVHRLVMCAFNGVSDLQVNHINCKKDDNRLENLEYCTNLENMRHAVKNGLNKQNKGEKHGMSILTEKNVIEIRELLENGELFQGQIAKKYKVDRTTINDINTRKTWKHI